MVHLKTTCDKRRTRQDGTHPIVFRISTKGKSRDISSGFSCHSQHWDYNKNSVREKSKLLEVLARRVKDKEIALLKRIREFDLECPFIYDIQDVKDYLCNKAPKSYTIKDFWIEEIARLHKAQHHSNAMTYNYSLLGFEKYVSMDINFDKINYAWLLNTETLMKENGLKTNTVFTYFKTLRSIMNRAINLEYIDYSTYPFRRYKIKSGSTAPRNLSLEEMRLFFNYTPTSNKLKQAHDIGKLVFMLRGINFTDLALLTRNSIRKGRIVFHRSKTKKLYSIKIPTEAVGILDKYSNVGDSLLLSLISEEEYMQKQKLPKIINQRRRVFNDWLKKIGTSLELELSLSSYTFRYSHAGICRQLGYSKDMISQSLGHQSGLRVTDAYLNDFDNAIIDDMNEHVIKEVASKT